MKWKLVLSESIQIDIDALRDYLMDYCGSAIFSGFPTAIIDIVEIESADGHELCQIAEQLDVNLRQFEVPRY